MKFTAFNHRSFRSSVYYEKLPLAEQQDFDVLGDVFHFKLNRFVAEELIDWDRVPEDPIYRLVFPRREMLEPLDFGLLRTYSGDPALQGLRSQLLARIRKKMAPHYRSAPESIPHLEGSPLPGMYNNFKTDLSLFPHSMVLTCHAYCNYCFRWVQFNNREFQLNSSYQDPATPVPWLQANPQVSDVLFTGADPMVVSAANLRKFIEPILEVESVKTIKISSKSLAWWPFRFLTDRDADELLRLFEEIVSRGKHLNLPAHFTHPQELEHPAVQAAVERIRSTGAVIRSQGPVIHQVNDSAPIWTRMWDQQVKLGIIPFYLFIEADHHPRSCFRIPLARTLEIFKTALSNASSMARSVRGPVFMYDLNRVLLDGVTELDGRDYFVLKTLQAPPGQSSEGDLKLLPYSSTAKSLGDLYRLFNPGKGDFSANASPPVSIPAESANWDAIPT